MAHNMENLYVLKTKLLESIWRLQRAIDDELDWFCAYLTEKDPKRRKLAREMFFEKQKERERIAKEEYERCK